MGVTCYVAVNNHNGFQKLDVEMKIVKESLTCSMVGPKTMFYHDLLNIIEFYTMYIMLV